ncbi:hypothetical protein Sinac_5839 [Singulisphaera acidiphila DSM 18658]|uniref:Uncharacterized protein n=1 Tax=Singulisphaera acidiphila (strain ATCC BAA-1392 / DSM 18658 / VKM B-2454 / MOB10) TaxID=886293 RepID=L0DMS1_SINAD|nr:hypothetical protein Sinac_5839 [Singulisphaera acidiphila DSM 18658]
MRAYRTENSSRRGNQVGVRHLTAWVLGCALGFAAYRGLMPPWPMPVKTRILSGAYNLAMGSAFGTMLTGTGVLISRRLQGDQSYPGLPGHWLLIFGLAAALADVAAVVVFRLLLTAWFPPTLPCGPTGFLTVWPRTALTSPAYIANVSDGAWGPWRLWRSAGTCDDGCVGIGTLRSSYSCSPGWSLQRGRSVSR